MYIRKSAASRSALKFNSAISQFLTSRDNGDAIQPGAFRRLKPRILGEDLQSLASGTKAQNVRGERIGDIDRAVVRDGDVVAQRRVARERVARLAAAGRCRRPNLVQ